eukprot:SAG11_NODE_3831_length_2198_cov_5.342544_3_plen_118_part_00
MVELPLLRLLVVLGVDRVDDPHALVDDLADRREALSGGAFGGAASQPAAGSQQAAVAAVAAAASRRLQTPRTWLSRLRELSRRLMKSCVDLVFAPLEAKLRWGGTRMRALHAMIFGK